MQFEQIEQRQEAEGWHPEFLEYTRFRFNLYDNFSDQQVAPNGTRQHGSSASFNTSRKEDDRLRFSTLRGYATAVIKKGPFMAVASLSVAGNNFNDGVLPGHDHAPMGPAGQREFQVETQLLYLQYNGWAQVRLERQMTHVGNGIVGHIVRDSVTALKQWNDRFNTQVTYVMDDPELISKSSLPGPTYEYRSLSRPGPASWSSGPSCIRPSPLTKQPSWGRPKTSAKSSMSWSTIFMVRFVTSQTSAPTLPDRLYAPHQDDALKH